MKKIILKSIVLGLMIFTSQSPLLAENTEEQKVSYQEIIGKINDVNTKNKENKRVKEIIKDYTYNTSDDDSKNSAREKALNQVKVIILEEIGVFVESYLEIDKVVTDKNYQKQFKQEIKNLTAGIIKTKILNEKYDGKTYFVKASVLVDPDSVSEGISEILKIKANHGEIKKLNELLSSKENEIDMRSKETIALQKKITNQEFLNRAKEEEIKQVETKLLKAEQLLKKYRAEELKITTRLDEINNVIKTKTDKAMENVERGMLYSEVIEVAGEPRAITKKYNDILLNYGKVVVHIENEIVRCITNAQCITDYQCTDYNSLLDRTWSPKCILK